MLSLVLGVSSFTVGILPLSFMLSTKRRLQLSTFGNGLLLGAALGVIIPEGIEAIMATEGSSSISQIAISLLVGFTFMLILEQYFTPHVISPTTPKPQPVFEMPLLSENPVEYVDQIDVETPTLRTSTEASNKSPPVQVIAYPLTLGLVIHSLADGLALGASASGENGSDTSLSLVVFIALIIHKSPTALALTSSLLSASLPRSDIRKHVAVFSVATPVGALVSFLLLSFIGAHASNWTGIALLLSGGTFLYVATVIQDVGAHSHDYGESLPAEEMSKLQRVSLIVGGIFLPFMFGTLLGHGHESGHAG